ncbi:MAG: DUF354 domain-containing protein [Anaerolineae bacterium]|nr:DUF354 domain-containing protein [Anaerolineae bacterium]
MRILIDIGHPAHVHFFKHAIWQLQERGDEVLISARDKDVTLALLDEYDFEYQILSAIGNGRLGMYKEFLWREWALIQLIRKFAPDVVTAVGGVFIAPACKLLNKPSIVFTDTEHVSIDRYLTYPLASVICTPTSFKKELGSSHLRYQGFQELAYLHPKYFQPDPKILEELGVTENEPYILVRFVTWKASHDVGHHGFSEPLKHEVLASLSKYGRIFITSEGTLPSAFEPYRINLSPSKIHHALAYASLYIGEGATMATEAGLLGTPSIYTSSLVGTMGNFEVLMHTHNLVYSYQDPREALQSAVSILEKPEVQIEWRRRRDKLLADTIDVTCFAVDLIENAQNKVNILG